MTLKNNVFRRNEANQVNDELPPFSTDNFFGGAINIDCERGQDENDKCQTTLADGNKFIDNYALVRGGAISYSSAGYAEGDGSSVYEGNTAGYHSDAISSYADDLNVTWTDMYGLLQ